MEVIMQDGIKDCGVCSLLSVIRYYGGNVSKEQLREWTNTSKNGVTAYKIIETANKVGFESIGMTGNLEDIKKSDLPVISHVIVNKSYQHFIVIYDIFEDTKELLIMDPAVGKRKISFSKFNLITSHNFIFLSPNKAILNIRDKHIIINILKDYLVNNKKYIIIVIVLTLIINILTIITAFHFKYLLDNSIEYTFSNNLIFLSLILFFAYLFKELAIYFKNLLVLKYSSKLDEGLTKTTFKQIILLPYLYYKNRTSGEVISRFRDLNIVKNFLAKVISFFTTDILNILIFIILMLNLNINLTLIVIIISLIIFLLTITFRKKLKPSIKKYYNREAIINSLLIEDIESSSVIKGMHLEKVIVDNFRIKYKKFLESFYSLNKYLETEKFLKNFIYGIFNLSLLGLGSYFVIKNKMSIGELLIFQNILNYYLLSFNNLMDLYTLYNSFKLAKTRLEDMFIVRSEKFEGGVFYNNYSLLKKIKFTNFSYAYNNKKLLTNINLVINPGDKVLLKGKSGTGKSTLVKSISRYIDISYGLLKIDDIDINHYHLDTIRNNVTYVSNQEFVFTGTVRDNLKVNKDYDDKALDKVCKITRFDEVIKKSFLGYDMLLEENGYNLSSGERQRLILARSLLKKSDIYIFDEAFSQIDLDKCLNIITDVFKYLKDKTIIIISHRLDKTSCFNRFLEIKNRTIYEEKL